MHQNFLAIFSQFFSCLALPNAYFLVSRTMSGHWEKHLSVLFLSPDLNGVHTAAKSKTMTLRIPCRILALQKALVRHGHRKRIR
jgi:hypothetical protein